MSWLPKLQYPQWYLTFRVFVIGTATGVAMVHAIHGPSLQLTLYESVASFGSLVLLGLFECMFAVLRHKRFVAELTRARSVNV